MASSGPVDSCDPKARYLLPSLFLIWVNDSVMGVTLFISRFADGCVHYCNINNVNAFSLQDNVKGTVKGRHVFETL